MLRAYGALPADSVRLEYQPSPSRSARNWTRSRPAGAGLRLRVIRATGAWHCWSNPDPTVFVKVLPHDTKAGAWSALSLRTANASATRGGSRGGIAPKRL